MPTLQPKRHWVVLLALCLTLGLITSIGVAWYFAWRGAPSPASTAWGKRRATETSPDPFPLKWCANSSQSTGITQTVVLVDASNELTDADEREFERIASDTMTRAALQRHAFLLHGGDGILVDITVLRYGWPAQCMGRERAFSRTDAQLRRRQMIMDEIKLDGYSLRPWSPDPNNTLSETYSTLTYHKHDLPVRPLWGGLAACTAFYASIWFVLLGSIMLLNKRHKPGTCQSCGYSLTGLSKGSPCPECGKPAGAKSVQPTAQL